MQAYPHGTVSLVIDCSELDRAAAFWCEVLGYRPMGQSDGKYLSLVPDAGEGIELLLQRVSDRKTAKNRVHLDLRTANLEVEVERVVRAGASEVTTEPLREGSWIWHICADPDGNEFCVLQPPGPFRPKPQTEHGRATRYRPATHDPSATASLSLRSSSTRTARSCRSMPRNS